MFRYNFDEHANDVINFAFSEARNMEHQYVGTEHLVLGLSMLKNATICQTFEYYQITSEKIREEIIKRIGRGNRSRGIEDYTPRAKECVERSSLYAKEMGSQEIMAEHLFISIMQEKESNGYQVLSALSLNIMNMIQWVFDKTITSTSSNIIKEGQSKQFDIKLMPLDDDYNAPEVDEIIKQITTNLTELAKDQVLGEVYGREGEIKRLIQILSRKTKNNPCIIGDPGIGKTALVYGLSKAIAEGNVPDNLKEKQILSVNTGALVSGTMYRGQFEQKMQKLIETAAMNNRYILFFDEIHTLVGLGATGEKSLDAIGLMKPYLTSGELQIIGTTTEEAYNRYFKIDQALTRRLIDVRIEEPSTEQTKAILEHIKRLYEEHHDVVISNAAIDAAISLSCRYMLQRKLPDKAIDLIDEACSRKRLNNLKTLQIIDELKYRLQKLKHQKEQAILAYDFDQASKYQQDEKRILDHIEKHEDAKFLMSNKKLTIDAEDIEWVVSEWVNIPVQKLSTREKEQLLQLDKLIAKELMGQDEAIDIVARALKRARVGIKDHHRPVGSFLFIGPTGVGKTELAKTIASVFYGSINNMVRFDMSEYMERHTISKLIGSPPGYEGNKDGGLLTNALERQPYTVLVFDEVEKAHLDVLNVLLQMMDEGRITDGRGIHVDSRNALIIMTSNLGVASLAQKTMGFGEQSSHQQHAIMAEKLRLAAKNYFKPEFINRLDEIVVFNQLDEGAMMAIVQKQLNQFEKLLEEEGISIQYDQSVVAWLAKTSYSETYGARPIKRIIDRHIKDPLADLLLAAQSKPLTYQICLKEDGLSIERNV